MKVRNKENNNETKQKVKSYERKTINVGKIKKMKETNEKSKET